MHFDTTVYDGNPQSMIPADLITGSFSWKTSVGNVNAYPTRSRVSDLGGNYQHTDQSGKYLRALKRLAHCPAGAFDRFILLFSCSEESCVLD